MPKLKVGVFFGSRSPEHDISIITAQQIISALDVEKYEVLPVYMAKDGAWYTGSGLMRMETFTRGTVPVRELTPVYLSLGARTVDSALPRLFRRNGRAVPLAIDVAFPAVHGPFGEDGTLQGVLELARIPYVGSGVVGSAVGMDKLVMKSVFRGNGLPILPYVGFSRRQWESRQEVVLRSIEQTLPYPLFIKPANLGSSIAVSKAKDRPSLIEALELASRFDRRLVVEQGLEDPVEINCAVLGGDPPKVSSCEQPVRRHEFLSFEDKYLRGGKGAGMKGADRLIPAPLSPDVTMEIQNLALRAFEACNCRGVARIDFLIGRNGEGLFINEINTLPGSLAFYLWQQTGVDFSTLCDLMIEEAMTEFREQERTTYTFSQSLLNR
jgi:D-alanine-D-alanine ligase